MPWNSWTSSSIAHLGGKNCLGKVWSILQDKDLTGGVRRRRESQESPVCSKKFPRIDADSAPTLVMMDGMGLKSGYFDYKKSQEAAKKDSKSVPIIADLSQSLLFNNSKTNATGSQSYLSPNHNPASKGKPIGRAKLLKAKGEEERLKVEKANQKSITEWIRQSSKRKEDFRKEKTQLEAMKMKREASKRMPPFPAYLVNMDPSPRTKKILSFPEDQDPADSDDPQQEDSYPPTCLPLPSLASSLKEEVLLNVSEFLSTPRKPQVPTCFGKL